MDLTTRETAEIHASDDNQGPQIISTTYGVSVLDSDTRIDHVYVTPTRRYGYIVYDPLARCCITYASWSSYEDDTFQSLKNSIADQNPLLDVEKWTSRGLTILALIKYLSTQDFSDKGGIPSEIDVYETRMNVIKERIKDGYIEGGRMKSGVKRHKSDKDENNGIITID